MARLIVISEGFGSQVLDLRLGVNHIGRHPESDFPIDHPTISAAHCELILGNGTLLLRDCNSTNGTFVGGRKVSEAMLSQDDKVRLGDVEFLVESIALKIAVPKFEIERPAPPVVLSDGGLVCPRHAHARATHQCVKCHEVLCDACVHRLRRRGGKAIKLCPLCSSPCERIGGEPKKKKSFLRILQKTIKLPFLGSRAARAERGGDLDADG